jgi:WD40 repeat protein
VRAQEGADVAFDAVAVQREAHAGDVNCVRWNRGRPGLLASCGDDNTARIWTVRD